MVQWIRNLLAALFGYFFDLGEFIAGILLGLLLAWGARRLSPTLDLLTTGKRKERQTFDRYRVDLIAQAQSMHLANPLFALDEIVVTPRLQAPPLPEDSESGEHPTADTLSVIPNLPDWNFLSGIYAAPSITLADALADGANLLITRAGCSAGGFVWRGFARARPAAIGVQTRPRCAASRWAG